MKLHLGCGLKHIDGFTNIDGILTPAVDEVMNLTDIPEGYLRDVEIAFSSAFFEHLRNDEKRALLKNLHDALAPGGFVLMVAIPDFTMLAKVFLGVVEATEEDIARVRDYDWINNQVFGGWDYSGAVDGFYHSLHKTIVTPKLVELLCHEAGFENVLVFNYRFRGYGPLIEIGFMAYDSGSYTLEDAKKHLSYLNPDVGLDSIVKASGLELPA